MEAKFTYGDSVRISADAPEAIRPGEIGAVCGYSIINGSQVYTIEYSDGSSNEIEERYLEKLVWIGKD